MVLHPQPRPADMLRKNGSAYEMEGSFDWLRTTPAGLMRVPLQLRRGFHIEAGWVAPSGERGWTMH
jgi:hypothetical protein